MSTKIYNGIIFKGSSAKDAAEDIQQIKRLCIEHQKRRLGFDISFLANELLDSIALGGDDTLYGKSAAEVALASIQDELQEVANTGLRNPTLDTECTAILFENRGDCLGMVFTESNEMRELFLNHPNIEEFYYWDNTDHPDGMSEEDWSEREMRWREAIGPDWVPANHGETIEVTALIPQYKLDEIQLVEIGFDSRVCSRVKDKVAKEHFKVTSNGDGWYKQMCERDLWLEKDETKALLDAEYEKFKQALPDVRSAADLLMPR